ncbi:hypothetical protein [Actinoplanes xinjiangensis]|uniref:hypothetical protein n=1 Tax=Actinoplanes xinjiangensis TaxID=512350 RepID=UPI00341323EB
MALLAAGMTFLDQRAANDLNRSRYERRYADRIDWWITSKNAGNDSVSAAADARFGLVFLQNRSPAPARQVTAAITYWITYDGPSVLNTENGNPATTLGPSTFEESYGYSETVDLEYRIPEIPPCTVVKMERSENRIPAKLLTAPAGYSMQVDAETNRLTFLDGQRVAWEKTRGALRLIGKDSQNSEAGREFDVPPPFEGWSDRLSGSLRVLSSEMVEDCTDN